MAAKELSAIIQAHHRALDRGEHAALATVVKTSGSTYRRAGARMWIGASGETVGSISGGCLEDDARDRAQEVIASGQPAMIHYDTMAEGDILWGSGIGCQGIVHVLVEPLGADKAGNREPDAGKPCALGLLAESLRVRRTSVLAVIFRVKDSLRVSAGEFLWCARDPETSASGATVSGPEHRTTFADAAFAKIVGHEAELILREGTPQVRRCDVPGGGEAEIFFDFIPPPQALLILGAGHDAVPLARLAVELGWRVRVADRRRAYVDPKRFPEAVEVVRCPAEEIGGDILPIEAGEAVVVMTHNYLQDLAILRAVLPTSAGYIGLLGPSRRKKLLLRELAESSARDADGDTVGDAAPLGVASLRRVHGPAGLDIGADAPEQIALSILAEIEAYSAKRRGGSLRRRRLPLHSAVPKVDLPVQDRQGAGVFT